MVVFGQVLSTLSYLVVSWYDPDLVWNCEEVDSPGEGICFIQINVKDIWVPQLLLVNKAEGYQASSLTNPSCSTFTHSAVSICPPPPSSLFLYLYPFHDPYANLGLSLANGVSVVVSLLVRVTLVEIYHPSLIPHEDDYIYSKRLLSHVFCLFLVLCFFVGVVVVVVGGGICQFNSVPSPSRRCLRARESPHPLRLVSQTEASSVLPFK